MDPDERAPTRAPAATGQAQSQDSEQQSAESLAEMLLTAFSKHGVSRSEPLGESFDPHLHQAGFRTRGTGHPPDTVTEVVRPGYTIHGRVLRPPLVGVSSATPEAGHGASEAQPAGGKANADTE